MYVFDCLVFLSVSRSDVQIINHVSPIWSNLSYLHQNALKLQFYHLPKFENRRRDNKIWGRNPTTKKNRIT